MQKSRDWIKNSLIFCSFFVLFHFFKEEDRNNCNSELVLKFKKYLLFADNFTEGSVTVFIILILFNIDSLFRI